MKDPSVRPAKLPTAKALFCLLALGGTTLLPGCALFTDAPHYRGIAVSPHDLSELTPGISTQADAAALLGPPTVQEQFDQNNWLYISQITKMRIGETEGVKKQQVVILTFDNNGVLQKIAARGLEHGLQVAMDSNQTPVPGGKASLVQQIVGGVGSYNPGIGGLGTSTTSGTGAGADSLGSSGLGNSGGGGF